jgi:hypothetical protein
MGEHQQFPKGRGLVAVMLKRDSLEELRMGMVGTPVLHNKDQLEGKMEGMLVGMMAPEDTLEGMLVELVGSQVGTLVELAGMQEDKLGDRVEPVGSLEACQEEAQ